VLRAGERGFRRWYEICTHIGYSWYIHRLTDECTATYIHRLTNEYTATCIHRLIDECTGLYSWVDAIFLDSGTVEYITVIFLGTEEYKSTEECT
jgi:hypothetical protein